MLRCTAIVVLYYLSTAVGLTPPCSLVYYPLLDCDYNTGFMFYICLEIGQSNHVYLVFLGLFLELTFLLCLSLESTCPSGSAFLIFVYPASALFVICVSWSNLLCFNTFFHSLSSFPGPPTSLSFSSIISFFVLTLRHIPFPIIFSCYVFSTAINVFCSSFSCLPFLCCYIFRFALFRYCLT